VERIV
jgi:hypothetical protein